MPILNDSTTDEVSRLLSLFPVATLKTQWKEVKGTKDVICDAAAQEADFEKITNFLQANFAQCKMHVYVLEPQEKTPEEEADPQKIAVSPISAVTDAEVIQVKAGGPTLFMVKVSFIVILQNALKKETVNLIWPMRLEEVEGQLVLSMIVLERTPTTIFEEPVSIVSRSIDEKQIVKNLASLGFKPMDLHKGMKSLWEADYMDAFNVRFRSPDSTLTEVMDEEKGIKATKPERYQELKQATMFLTAFHLLSDSVKSIKDFTMDPSKGYLRFPRYTEDAGDADEVVRAILEQNH